MDSPPWLQINLRGIVEALDFSNDHQQGTRPQFTLSKKGGKTLKYPF